MNEVDDLNRENTGLNLKLRDNEMMFDRERSNLENGIDKLRD